MITGSIAAAAKHGIVAINLALVLTSQAVAQTQIGSWKFNESSLSTRPGVYLITSSIGNSKEDSYSSVDLYCENGKYTFYLMPAANPLTGRNDLPDGAWSVQLSINNQFIAALSARSQNGMIGALVPKETVLALTSVQPRSPVPDVLTAMIEKLDGSRIQQAINYPAARFRAAMNILAEACRTDR